MAIFKYFLRLQYIDFLIRRKATGDIKTFADKNRLSKSGLSSVLKDMKEMGFPIKYDKNKQSYLYTKEGQMAQQLFVESKDILSRNDLRHVGLYDINNLCFSETSVIEPCEKK
nr:hypothetical protein [Mucilaginibacter sp. L294]